VRTADIVAEAGGVLGMVTYPLPDLPERLRVFLSLAEARGLAADFHVDETMDPGSETLRAIAEAVLETGFAAPVTVGHCCSLSTQAVDRAMDTLDLVARAGIAVVSLPLCNLYLQDRQPGRTPRNRGITLVHEMRARGIPVSFASDNTRDPFYAYGDMDMVEVMREATRIGHLDHSRADWPLAFTAAPARACGLPAPSLAPGAPADLVICRARSWTELFARPQSDRIVLRAGRAIDRTLPDYAELDDLMTAPVPEPAR
jgi:cytosine deaminase